MLLTAPAFINKVFRFDIRAAPTAPMLAERALLPQRRCIRRFSSRFTRSNCSGLGVMSSHATRRLTSWSIETSGVDQLRPPDSIEMAARQVQRVGVLQRVREQRIREGLIAHRPQEPFDR